jgi:alpha 1,3-glucosidase
MYELPILYSATNTITNTNCTRREHCFVLSNIQFLQLWYDLSTFKAFTGGSRLKYDVSISTVPAFQRGGTIVFRKERMRRAAWLTRFDPFVMWIALDAQKSAKGTIYVDDYHSFNYKTSKEFGYYQVQFVNNRLECMTLDKAAHYKTTETVERIVFLGYPNKPTSITLKSENGTRQLPFGYLEERKLLVVRKPDVSPVSTWSLEIN